MKSFEMLRTVRQFIRQPYAWPGGYPLFLIGTDGCALCKGCAADNYRFISAATRSNNNNGWQAAGVDVNWEDTGLYCDQCGNKIESAYGEE